jgi:3-oxoacyl-[acyl-carrier-protein] synthase II
MNQAVWISGIGMITPLGIGWQENWQAMCQGQSGVRAIRSFDATGLASRIAGEVPERFEKYFADTCRLPFPNRYARFTQLALAAGKLALEDAALDLQGVDKARIGVALGVGAGAFHYLLAVNDALAKKAESLEAALDHNFVVKYMANAATAQMSVWLGLRGPSTTLNAACASGAQAIATGMDWIRAGRADLVLVGGTDSTVNRFAMHAYSKINALSTHNEHPQQASRPFDKRRNGFVMAEGACVLLLESERHARARSAERHAQLLGHASTSEAYNIVMPRPEGEGIARTIRLALADAGLDGEQIGYISAHGTSTPLNDIAETAGIKKVFGERAYRIPISSQKSMIGHAIGATSAIEAGVTALTIRHGLITPTINYQEPDPECDLDYVPNQARTAPVEYALSNAFGFGGHNCCLAFGK